MDPLPLLEIAATAIKGLDALGKQSKGNSRALILELKDNLLYLDMVAKDGVELGDVIEKISTVEFKRLSKEGYDFNRLKNSKIAKYPWLEGTNLSTWGGKRTDELIESIYEKLNELKICFPLVSGSAKKYRWKVRVNNIRRRIWLLLKHVRT